MTNISIAASTSKEGKQILNPMLPFIFIRAAYARWALHYIPPLIDGKPNPDYDMLNNWAMDERLAKYFQGAKK